MTDNQRAVKELTERYDLWQKDYADQMPEYGAVLSNAITALKKQVPQTPTKSRNPVGQEYWFCPQCGAIAVPAGEEELLTDYCSACGQRFAWWEVD